MFQFFLLTKLEDAYFWILMLHFFSCLYFFKNVDKLKNIMYMEYWRKILRLVFSNFISFITEQQKQESAHDLGCRNICFKISSSHGFCFASTWYTWHMQLQPSFNYSLVQTLWSLGKIKYIKQSLTFASYAFIFSSHRQEVFLFVTLYQKVIRCDGVFSTFWRNLNTQKKFRSVFNKWEKYFFLYALGGQKFIKDFIWPEVITWGLEKERTRLYLMIP